MASVAQSAPAGRVGSRGARRTRRSLLGGGVLWIVLFAALLAGVVAVNVSVLRLNLELDRANHERSDLRAEVALLRSELSSASATRRIDKLAQKELGLVPADPDDTIYIELRR